MDTTTATPDREIPPSLKLSKSQRAVLGVLEENDWSCGVDFGQGFVGWSFASRISEMRSLGIEIESRRCHRHAHRTAVVEYRLKPDGDDQLEGIG